MGPSGGSEKTVASVKIWPQGDPLGGFLGLLGLVVPGGQVQGELRGQETARALPHIYKKRAHNCTTLVFTKWTFLCNHPR